MRIRAPTFRVFTPLSLKAYATPKELYHEEKQNSNIKQQNQNKILAPSIHKPHMRMNQNVKTII